MPTLAAFPKLLVVSAFAPNDRAGGGALARQLLKGYPPERINWWTPQPDPEGPQRVQELFTCWIPPRLQPVRKLTRLRSWLMEQFWVPRATVHLAQVKERVRPDHIWALPWGWTIPVLAKAQLLQASSSHASIWDYPDTLYASRLFGTHRANRFMRNLCNIYQAARTVDAVGESMRLDLARRTGRQDGFVLHSGLEPENLEWLSNAPPAEGREIRIAYAGSILAPPAFAVFIEALNRARRTLTRPLKLEFFGGRNHHDESWFDQTWMHNHGHLQESEFLATLRDCSWGVVVMDLTDEDPQYSRYSFPNKFGTYLGAGLPLLVLAHRESSAALMIRAYPTGFFADNTDVPEIERFLSKALATPSPRESFRNEIIRCGQTEFNAARMRATLWEALGVK